MKAQYLYIAGIVIILILIIIMINRRTNNIISPNETTAPPLPKDNQSAQDIINAQIRVLASKLKASMSEKDMKEANLLSDGELMYLNTYYNEQLALNSKLYNDIDDAWRPFTSEDELLMKRLERLKLT